MFKGFPVGRKGGLKANRVKNKKDMVDGNYATSTTSAEKDFKSESNLNDEQLNNQNRRIKTKQTLNKETNANSPEGQTQASKKPNSEKEKKIRHVAKKLSDIKKLKLRQEQGETLELNQLNKISMEAKFLEELKDLKLTTSETDHIF